MMKFTIPALVALCVPATAIAQNIAYTLSGSIHVQSEENAAARMIVDIAGQVLIGPDGEIGGQGHLTYLWMEPCGWVPPEPENGIWPHCRITGVNDGSFAITGSVLESLHRHDTDNPLTEAVFAFADEYSDGRVDYAPSQIELQLWPQELPGESLLLWGFSDGGMELRGTNGAVLGLAGSTIFDAPIQITALPAGAAGGAEMALFEGAYQGGSPAYGRGGISLVDFPYDLLPHATDPAVWNATWPPGVEPPAEDLATWEEMLEATTQPDSREDVREEVLALTWEFTPPPIEGITTPTPEFLEHIDGVRDFLQDTGSSAIDGYNQVYPYSMTEVYPFNR